MILPRYKNRVYGCDDYVYVTCWDTDTGKKILDFKAHTNFITCTLLSKDSKTLYTGSKDCNIRIWNTDTGE